MICLKTFGVSSVYECHCFMNPIYKCNNEFEFQLIHVQDMYKCIKHSTVKFMKMSSKALI